MTAAPSVVTGPPARTIRVAVPVVDPTAQGVPETHAEPKAAQTGAVMDPRVAVEAKVALPETVVPQAVLPTADPRVQKSPICPMRWKPVSSTRRFGAIC